MGMKKAPAVVVDASFVYYSLSSKFCCFQVKDKGLYFTVYPILNLLLEFL